MIEGTTRRRDCSSRWHRHWVFFFVGRSLETTQFSRSAGKRDEPGDGVWKKNIRFFCYYFFCCVCLSGSSREGVSIRSARAKEMLFFLHTLQVNRYFLYYFLAKKPAENESGDKKEAKWGQVWTQRAPAVCSRQMKTRRCVCFPLLVHHLMVSIDSRSNG
jgi:hypothetical protein